MTHTNIAIFNTGGRCVGVQTCPTAELEAYQAGSMRTLVVDELVPPSEVDPIESLNDQFEAVLSDDDITVGETVSISSIPSGATVRIDGLNVSEDVEAGSLEITPDDAGTYVIRLSADGYDDLILSLEVS